MVVTHRKGHPAGLLVPERGVPGGSALPLDVLGGETQWTIGYLLEQDLNSTCDLIVPAERRDHIARLRDTYPSCRRS